MKSWGNEYLNDWEDRREELQTSVCRPPVNVKTIIESELRPILAPALLEKIAGRIIENLRKHELIARLDL